VTNPAPILRWAGGKRQLQSTLLSVLPRGLDLGKNKYFEPFFGGGALFFALASLDGLSWTNPSVRPAKHYILSDSNADLISFYKAVRDAPGELIRRAKTLEADLSEAAFYRVRRSSPTSELGRAARMLYLNRLCFNGLYRVNSSGEFNVPFGKLKNPVVCNPPLIHSCSLWLRNAKLQVA